MSSSETLSLIRTTAPFPPNRPTNPFHWRLSRRRRRVPIVRLGGGEKNRGGGGRCFIIRVCRKARVQWLKLKYMNMMRRVKECYETFIEDLLVTQRTTEDFQKTMVMEASAVIPVMGL